jgi:hypothetical protein
MRGIDNLLGSGIDILEELLASVFMLMELCVGRCWS